MDTGKKFIVPFIAICFSLAVWSQHKAEVLLKVDSLVAANQLRPAQELIESSFYSVHDKGFNRGSLLYLMARTELLLDKQTGFLKAKALLRELENTSAPDSVRYEAYLGIGLVHVDQGSVMDARTNVKTAHSLAKKLKDPIRLLESEYHLGEISLKLGEFSMLVAHTEEALRLLRAYPGINFRLAPRVYNYKGALMHFSAQPDSANYYFEQAIASVNPDSEDPEQRYYLPGAIYGNWTLVKQSAAEYDQALDLTIKGITHFNDFLRNTVNHPLTEKVHGNLSIAYRNLGSTYNDLGRADQAIHVATLGYHHAKKNFLPNTVQYFSAILMKGEAHLYNEDLGKARKYLEEARASLTSVPGDNWTYWASLYFTLGDLEKKERRNEQAIGYYQQALSAYETGNPGEFNQNIIFARINLAQALSQNDDFETADQLLAATEEEVRDAYGEQSYLYHMVQLTRLRATFEAGDYLRTKDLCEQLLYAFQSRNGTGNMPYLWSERAEVLSYLVRAELARGQNKMPRLKELSGYMDTATSYIEKAKSLVTTQEGVNALIANNQLVFDAAKQLYVTLYDLSGKKEYLEKVLAMHESAIYNRIRARLNLVEHTLVPEPIREKETNLKNAINSFFNMEAATEINMVQWDSLLNAWQDHLHILAKEHPRYYTMRYASIIKPVSQLQDQMAAGTTLVRYMTVGGEQLAVVIRKDSMKLLKLGTLEAGDCISNAADFRTGEDTLLECLYELYQGLWAPLEAHVNTEKVIILPDGELFNLSFELLTPTRIATFRELSTGSLLDRHDIAYNYSLFMIPEGQHLVGYDQDFIAFAPGFDEGMKTDYKLAVSDSVFLDRTYLTLLPQPFSSELVRKYSRRFNGSSFLDENASKQLFIDRAREHKIIHIGTHAESDNVNPELSRLVFAKNISDRERLNDNYLYAYEIYDQNLNSDLAILTACETGRPAYQPGEGMISLAHAFNYAGSKSVLTSLWQIDEKSSAAILGYFYEHLATGLSKDKALKQAKLEYLAGESGRTLHPQYWAGLVLMGDTTPIPLSGGTPWVLWLFGGVLVSAAGYWWYKKKSSRKGSPE